MDQDQGSSTQPQSPAQGTEETLKVYQRREKSKAMAPIKVYTRRGKKRNGEKEEEKSPEGSNTLLVTAKQEEEEAPPLRRSLRLWKLRGSKSRPRRGGAPVVITLD